jgi:hypothetical protein
MTYQPVVVKRQNRGNAPLGQQSDDAGRQAREVMNVRGVWSEVVDDVLRDRVDDVIRVRVFERSRVAEGVVHSQNSEAVSVIPANVVFRTTWIVFARQYKDVVSIGGERAGVRVGVNLAATLR